MRIKFVSKLWEWNGQGAWCFVTLPAEYYEDIKLVGNAPRQGFGSVKVEAKIGKTIWKTSIFPDKKLGCYLLPVKKLIRKSETLAIGDELSVTLRLISN